VPGYKPKSLVCWWVNSELIEFTWRMAVYYNALVVPEMNKDRGLAEALRDRSIPMYYRQEFNHRFSKMTDFLGWMTDQKTKPMILEKLKTSIIQSVRHGGVLRGEGIELRCPWIIKQMQNFGTKMDGTMCAMSGHDDDVMSTAIGVQTEKLATMYVVRVTHTKSQWDLMLERHAEESTRLQVPSTYS
jgi:hypothetical protein